MASTGEQRCRSYRRKRKGTGWNKVLHLCSNKPSKVGISDEKESNGHTMNMGSL